MPASTAPDGADPAYRVYAIRYAQRAGATRAMNFYGGDAHDGPMPMDYFIWLVVGTDGWLVVDAGFTPEAGARRPGREMVCDPMAVLAQLGAEPAATEDVILTHLHYDHAGILAPFTRATFWVQEREMAFWTGRYASRRELKRLVEPGDIVGLVALNFEGRVRMVSGEARVAPGITLHEVGGHAAGLQVVRVDTGAGVIVLASDAAHYYENLLEDRPFRGVYSLPDMYGAFDRVRELAPSVDDVVPGHDPLVFERYRAPSPELEGVVVEITPRAAAHDARGRVADVAQ